MPAHPVPSCPAPWPMRRQGSAGVPEFQTGSSAMVSPPAPQPVRRVGEGGVAEFQPTMPAVVSPPEPVPTRRPGDGGMAEFQPTMPAVVSPPEPVPTRRPGDGGMAEFQPPRAAVISPSEPVPISRPGSWAPPKAPPPPFPPLERYGGTPSIPPLPPGAGGDPFAATGCVGSVPGGGTDASCAKFCAINPTGASHEDSDPCRVLHGDEAPRSGSAGAGSGRREAMRVVFGDEAAVSGSPGQTQRFRDEPSQALGGSPPPQTRRFDDGVGTGSLTPTGVPVSPQKPSSRCGSLYSGYSVEVGAYKTPSRSGSVHSFSVAEVPSVHTSTSRRTRGGSPRKSSPPRATSPRARMADFFFEQNAGILHRLTQESQQPVPRTSSPTPRWSSPGPSCSPTREVRASDETLAMLKRCQTDTHVEDQVEEVIIDNGYPRRSAQTRFARESLRNPAYRNATKSATSLAARAKPPRWR
eukprot:TRINITY_DN10891_c0_g1_i4.p1 TRINITY_DN10891_c0_g1~~TRINITY_DN10891_c0_g1_i4.p1  ORF type:complete len:496 (-),score=51.53 TRINITY_DN10891_c0_g1_i4:29-1432(-)